MRIGLVVLVACSSGGDPHPKPTPPPEPVQAPTTGVSGAIHLLALTEDGGAAVSVDDQHGARLWPALDGTREPVVIALDQPAEVAIARDGNGFAIGELDEAGTARIIAVGADGRVRARTELAANARAIALSPRTAIVLGDDRVVELIDRDGTRHRLAPPPSTAIEEIAYRDGHALAILHGAGRSAQWIDLATARWGEVIARPLPDGNDPELSPDGARLLLHTPRASLVVELASRTKPTFIGTSCGYVDAKRMLCTDGNDAWVDGDDPNHTRVTSATAIASAGGRAVAATGGALALIGRDRTRYLGYGLSELAHFRSAPFGLIVGDPKHRAIALDAQLNIVGTTQLPADKPLHELAFIDAHHAVATTWAESIGELLSVFVDGVPGAVLANDAIGPLRFEPATNLLAYASTRGIHLAKWTGTAFTPATLVADTPRDASIALLDPQRAHGWVLATGVARDGFTQLRFYTADDLASGKPGTRWRVPGMVREIDRTGRAYIASSTNLIVAWEAGQPVATMPEGTVLPSPDGATIAVMGAHELTLVGRDGTARWAVPAIDIGEVRWMASGQLVARFPGSLAVYDLATGAIATRRCGWEFALRDERIDNMLTGPTACDAVP